MNVYEEAHRLAQAVVESGEYKDFARLRTEAYADEALRTELERFESFQQDAQQRMTRGEIDQQQVLAEMQQLFAAFLQDPRAAQYLQAAARFSLMMTDVYKIIADAVQLENGPNV